MPLLNPDRAVYLLPMLSRSSGPLIPASPDYSVTASYSSMGALETRRLILLADTHPELRRLLEKGDTQSTFQPRIGTVSTGGGTTTVSGLPGNTPVGIGFGIAISIGEIVAMLKIDAEERLKALIESGAAYSTETQDLKMVASVVEATRLALQTIPVRVKTRTLKDKNRNARRIKIHGFSKRAGT